MINKLKKLLDALQEEQCACKGQLCYANGLDFKDAICSLESAIDILEKIREKEEL